MREFRTRDVGLLIVFAAICGAIAGCGSTQPTAAPRSINAPSIDACMLLSPDDVAALLNSTVTGKPTAGGPDISGCVWENPSTYESVSVEIGNSGTAVNGTLRPLEPGLPDMGSGPDGMRFLGSGMVEFPAAGRSNTVQVAVLRLSGDEANAAAVELARKITPQIPS